MSVVEFTIPAVPPSINDRQRKAWRFWHQRTKEWKRIVWAHAFQARAIPRVPATGATVTLCFRLPRGGDPDNRAKLLLDGLVAAKILKGDGPPHLVDLRLQAERGKPAQTFVRIEPA